MTTPTNLRRSNPQYGVDGDGTAFLRRGETGATYDPQNQIRETKSANFTLDNLDHGKLFIVDTAGVDCTVPAGLRADFHCEFIFTASSGDFTLEASSTTINPSGTLNISTRYGKAELDHLGSDVYNFAGTIA